MVKNFYPYFYVSMREQFTATDIEEFKDFLSQYLTKMNKNQIH
jgi:hypothetical protein